MPQGPPLFAVHGAYRCARLETIALCQYRKLKRPQIETAILAAKIILDLSVIYPRYDSPVGNARRGISMLLLPMSQPVCSHEQAAEIGGGGSNEARQHPERVFYLECNGLTAYPTYRAKDVAKISTRLCHNS